MNTPLLEHEHGDPNLPHRWTTEEYYALAAYGAFDGAGRTELLDGELFLMPPQLTPHASTIFFTTDALRGCFHTGFVVRSQLPITLADGTEPEPDFCVARGTGFDFLHHHPTPAEIVLVVEVSDSTLAKDRTRKAAIYARAGLPEYWIVNVIDRQLEVLRGPRPDGVYGSQTVLLPGETVTPLSAPDAVPIAVSALLPLAV